MEVFKFLDWIEQEKEKEFKKAIADAQNKVLKTMCRRQDKFIDHLGNVDIQKARIYLEKKQRQISNIQTIEFEIVDNNT